MLKEVTISEALQAAQDGADVTVLISKGGDAKAASFSGSLCRSFWRPASS